MSGQEIGRVYSNKNTAAPGACMMPVFDRRTRHVEACNNDVPCKGAIQKYVTLQGEEVTHSVTQCDKGREVDRCACHARHLY